MPSCRCGEVRTEEFYNTRNECRACKSERSRLWRLANKRRHRDNDLRRRYGISIDTYESLIESQQGLCAICREPEQRRALSVDHDHQSLLVRGLLCDRCNLGLGFIEDRQWLSRAASYLDGRKE